MFLDPNTITLIKDKAEKYFSKGKFADALKTYEELRPCGAKDPRVFIRIAEIARKLDDVKASIAAYKEAIDAFTKLGFIVKAIAICKMVIQMDPKEEAIQRRLAEFYSAANKPHTEVKEAKKIEEKEETPPHAEPDKPKIRQFPRAPLFSDFTKEELFDVVRKVKFLSIPEGVTLFKEGDEGDSIFIIVSGELEVINAIPDGKPVTVAKLDREGEFFGEFAFFANSERTSTVKTVTPVELLEIRKSDLNEISAKYPSVTKVLFNFYKERVVDRLMALSKIFRPMKKDDRLAILKTAELKTFESGALVMKEGDIGDTMYLIQEGRAKVWLYAGAGTEQMLGELKEGDFFGEVALATSKPRVANVSAETTLKVVEFSRSSIKAIVDRYPEVKSILEDIIKGRMTDTMQAKKMASSNLL